MVQMEYNNIKKEVKKTSQKGEIKHEKRENFS